MVYNFYFMNDELIRLESHLQDTSTGVREYKEEKTVITKEEFVACYNEWIKKEENNG